MARIRLDGNPPVEVTLRRSARARRLSLRVSRLDGTVSLTLPARAPEREALAFLREREAWVRGHLAQVAPARAVAEGALVPVEGRDCRVVVAPGRAALREGELRVAPGRPPGPQVRALLKARARDRLVEASGRYAVRLGRPHGPITLRDTRSRWGSCASSGALSYSWRLVMAPPEVLDYVAAHEVAHLEEANHAPAFWAVVARLFPGYAAPRAWLRREGSALLRFGFDD